MRENQALNILLSMPVRLCKRYQLSDNPFAFSKLSGTVYHTLRSSLVGGCADPAACYHLGRPVTSP
ncbi:hypothetical protein BN1200_1510065 [Klebsiella variicola]|nr:hypothetical protein BN1200_1510065 [Klebsiella variicola]